MNKRQNYAAFDNSPYITASHQAWFRQWCRDYYQRQHSFDVCSQKLLQVKIQTNPTWPFYSTYFFIHLFVYFLYELYLLMTFTYDNYLFAVCVPGAHVIVTDVHANDIILI